MPSASRWVFVLFIPFWWLGALLAKITAGGAWPRGTRGEAAEGQGFWNQVSASVREREQGTRVIVSRRPASLRDLRVTVPPSRCVPGDQVK